MHTHIHTQDFKWNYLFVSFLSRDQQTIITARPNINKRMWSSIWNASGETKHQIFINLIQNYTRPYSTIMQLNMLFNMFYFSLWQMIVSGFIINHQTQQILGQLYLLTLWLKLATCFGLRYHQAKTIKVYATVLVLCEF
jgi:hypothetical protein